MRDGENRNRRTYYPYYRHSEGVIILHTKTRIMNSWNIHAEHWSEMLQHSSQAKQTFERFLFSLALWTEQIWYEYTMYAIIANKNISLKKSASTPFISLKIIMAWEHINFYRSYLNCKCFKHANTWFRNHEVHWRRQMSNHTKWELYMKYLVPARTFEA